MPPSVREDVSRFRAKDLPNSWVIGYEGRVFCNGHELARLQDEAPRNAVSDFNKDRAGGNEGWPVGPLGWSFADLVRGDRIGLLAEDTGHLSIFVNKELFSKIKLEGLCGHVPYF